MFFKSTKTWPIKTAVTGMSYAVLACAMSGSGWAADIIVDTDAGTINGVASGGSFNGVPFTVAQAGGVTTFTFAGDFTVNDSDRVIGIGGSAAAFKAANNAVIGDNVFFDFSARNSIAGPGGGAGGLAGPPSSAGQGGLGGSGGVAGAGGLGATTNCSPLSGCSLGDGGMGGAGGNGAAGLNGLVGGTGSAGANGAAGINGSAGGVGGTGGSGGANGSGGAVGGAGGVGGFGGDEASARNVDASSGTPGGNAGNGDFGSIGQSGQSGGNASSGSNGGSGLILTGGGGGGAGGNGGSGGGGGGGAGGGAGGGGGGGGSAASFFFEEADGGAGGAGAAGGRGADGGDGGRGGVGGFGGGGGGAFEISAQGRVIIGASTFLEATGASGSPGQNGGSGAAQSGAIGGSTGAPGSPGQTRGSVSAGSGGDGGASGAGGFGGDGGTGGDGGQGGGGAGGTVKVFGSVVDASGSVINAQGGGLSPFRGELGRFVLGNNTSSDAPIGIAAVTQSFDGARGMNIFTQDLAETPFIPDLVDGAELFGLLDDVTAQDTFFSALQSGSPNNAIGAVLRVDIGPGPGYNDDYTGFDMLLMLALGDTAINAPTLGFDPHGGVYQQPLTIGGYTRDLVFGGAGDMVLPSLLGNTIFATLIPEVDGFVSASGADAFGNLLLFGDQQLANGEAFYLVSQVPLPASGVFLLSGLSGLGLFRRVRKKALNL